MVRNWLYLHLALNFLAEKERMKHECLYNKWKYTNSLDET